VPNEIYRCADERWLAVTARSDDEWLRLCGAIGDEELGADPRLRTASGRRAEIERIDRRLAVWSAARPAADAESFLQAHGIPAGVVQNARDLVEVDPQLRAREWLADVGHASLGTQSIDRFPARFSAATLEPYRAAPALHQHTFEVYAEILGMSDEETAAAIGDGLLV
jgi:crotonobetainyl-CoA:carnitine CoA-transferase CaiB-like acyl-CoA transferase